MRRSRLALLGVGCVLAATSATGRARAAAKADEKPAPPAIETARQALVGQWQLNAALSDDPHAKMRERGGSAAGGDRGGDGGGRGGGGGWGGGGRGGGGMGRGGGGGWGGGRGGGMGHGGPGGAQSSTGALRALLFTAPQITITNLTPEVTILQPDGGIRRLQADDKAHKDETGTEVKARWDESRLVVDTKSERGHLKETWTATGDPKRLEVLTEVERPFGDTVKIKRVYDAVGPNAPTQEPPAPPAAADPSKP
jgi:hypothetical protein